MILGKLLGKVVGKRIGVTQAAVVHIGVNRGRALRTRVIHGIGTHAVETVIGLAIFLQAAVHFQAQVFNDLPIEGRVGVPDGTRTAGIVVGHSLQRRNGIAVVVFILLTGHIAGYRDRRIQYGMFQTAVAGRGTGVVVDGVGAGTAHIGAGITHVQVQRRGLRGLEITLEAEVVAGVVRTHHDGFLAQVGITDGPVVILSASGDREIRIPGISRAAEDGIHPVVGGQTEEHIHIVERAEVGIVHVGQVVAEGTEFILEFDEVLGIHHVDGALMGHLLLSEVGVQFHRNLLSLLSALGRNDHDTVRTAATVDSGREGILQDVDGLNF